MKEVSIIISVSNDSIYFPKCLDSIINQKFSNLEIIIINNSNDNINRLIKKYTDEYDNISIADSLNSAIKISCGEYIGFVDSNDYIHENMISTLFNSAKNNSLDIIMCQMSSLDDLTNELDKDLHDLTLTVFKGFKKDIFNYADIINFITQIYSKPFNKLFKSSFIKENNINFSKNIFKDEIFFYDTILKANKISVVNEELYVRRFNNRFIKGNKYDDYVDIIPT